MLITSTRIAGADQLTVQLKYNFIFTRVISHSNNKKTTLPARNVVAWTTFTHGV